MSTEPLKIKTAIIQAELVWENYMANIQKFDQLIGNINSDTDLVVLPETFSTGFTMNVKDHTDHGNKTLDWMIRTAQFHRIYLTGSIIANDEGRYYNRLYWVDPMGSVTYYNKRHLFRMGGEEQYYSPGNQRVIAKIGDFRFLLQICYDLRFPVFARNRKDYDVIVYVANWPMERKHVWDSLLIARALENQSYVIGANCCGIDGEGVENCGASCIIDAKGQYKTRLKDQPGILYSVLDLEEITSFRKKFPVWKDADDFQLK
ncbi:MAG: amidohydrolase [Bacteroidales bacterium]|nr:amidohydrolase [Bacteroidales bacterium]